MMKFQRISLCSNTLFHYTTLENAKKIIEEGKIRTGNDVFCFFTESEEKARELFFRLMEQGTEYIGDDLTVHKRQYYDPQGYVILKIAIKNDNQFYRFICRADGFNPYEYSVLHLGELKFENVEILPIVQKETEQIVSCIDTKAKVLHKKNLYKNGLKRTVAAGAMAAILTTNTFSVYAASHESWLDLGKYDISWYSASESNFDITTAKQLAGISYLVNNNETLNGKTFNILNDIDLTAYEWVTIPKEFNGVIEGLHKVLIKTYQTPFVEEASDKGEVSVSYSVFSTSYESWLDSGKYDISWYSASESNFNITTAKQLAGISYLVNNNETLNGKTFNILNDIDLTAYEWVTIPKEFNGVIEGLHKVLIKTYQTPFVEEASDKGEVSVSYSVFSTSYESWLDSGKYDISWYSASESNFNITTAKQLAGISYLVNNNETLNGKTFNILNDIDLTAYEWVTIPKEFNGVIEGLHKVLIKTYQTPFVEEASDKGGVLVSYALPVSGIEDGKSYCGAVDVTGSNDSIDNVKINGVEVNVTNGKFRVFPANNIQRVVVTDKAGNDVSYTITVNNGHSWGEVTYEWASDNSTCTATRSCTVNDCDGKETETVDSASALTQEQTCILPELTTYKATFTNAAFAMQTRENVQTAKAAGHSFSSELDSTCNACSFSRTVPYTITKGAKNNPNTGVEAVETGDSSYIVLWGDLLLSSIAAIVALLTKKKRQIR